MPVSSSAFHSVLPCRVVELRLDLGDHQVDLAHPALRGQAQQFGVAPTPGLRQHRHADQPVRRGRAELHQPVVVDPVTGLAQHRVVGRIWKIGPKMTWALDAVAVHVLEPQFGDRRPPLALVVDAAAVEGVVDRLDRGLLPVAGGLPPQAPHTLPSQIHTAWPSRSSICGARPRNSAGSRSVHRSAGNWPRSMWSSHEINSLAIIASNQDRIFRSLAREGEARKAPATKAEARAGARPVPRSPKGRAAIRHHPVRIWRCPLPTDSENRCRLPQLRPARPGLRCPESWARPSCRGRSTNVSCGCACRQASETPSAASDRLPTVKGGDPYKGVVAASRRRPRRGPAPPPRARRSTARIARAVLPVDRRGSWVGHRR